MDEVPAAPDHLPPAARDVWDRLAGQMHVRGLLTGWDVEAFAAYCMAWAMHVDASRELAESGALVSVERRRFNRGGDLIATWVEMVENPAVKVAKESAATLRAFAQEFGLTPSARSGIKLPEAESDELARILN